MSVPLRVTVVGGGIAGLAVAHRLVELGRQRVRPIHLTLLEAGPRLGGNIRTECLASPGQAGAFLIESGPDGFVTEKPWPTLASRSAIPSMPGGSSSRRRNGVRRVPARSRA